MNYSALLNNLRNEMGKMSQYKNLDQPYMAFAIIMTIPFWIIYASFLISAYVLLYTYKCVSASNDYLESWLKDNKKDIHPLTEAVLYLVAMPFIFFMRCILSIFGIMFFSLWFNLQWSGYIASLGGIKWRPFISEADYESGIKYKATTPYYVGNVIALVGFALMVIAAILTLVSIEEYDVLDAAMIFMAIYNLFIIIAIPAGFTKEPVKPQVAPAPEKTESAPKAESTASNDNNDEDIDDDDLPSF